MKLLADTGALLALAMRRDRNHRAAVAFLTRNADARFILTDLILAELVTRLRARTDAGRAVGAARDVLRSRRYEVLFADAALVDGALAQMTRFADKRLSLTDCVSFELMHRLGLTTAFAFDRDFRDCGFTLMP